MKNTHAKILDVLKKFKRDEDGCLPHEALCDGISACLSKAEHCPDAEEVVKYRMFKENDELVSINAVVFSSTLVDVSYDGFI